MSDGVRVSRTTLVLAGALAVALIAVSALATYLIVSRASDASHSSMSTAPIPSAPPTSTPTPSGPPKLVSRATGGRELEALQAVALDCASDTIVEGAFMVASVDVSADLRSLTIDGSSQDELKLWSSLPAEPLAVHECALGMLEAPGGVLDRMERTRALDGTQSAEWSNYKVTWTYHPDQGLDAVFSYTD